MENKVQELSSRGGAIQEQQQSGLNGGVGRTDLRNNTNSNNANDDADSRANNNNNKQDRDVGSREDHRGQDNDADDDDPDVDVDVDMVAQDNNIALQQQQEPDQQRLSSEIFGLGATASFADTSFAIPVLDFPV
ncbi:hypothetical protein BGZ91_002178 [Linnemannia elongata]|nr:hypothetical protein BGZ91_002178 [Linnemannia elongata]KAG0079597.1 hypothetical protein BGZ90_002156 [Linnemannia elongata]